MTRIALGVEYAGDAFLGWQSQAHGRTVQDVLEAALGQVAGETLRLHCAGRTDAGVPQKQSPSHARGFAKPRACGRGGGGPDQAEGGT